MITELVQTGELFLLTGSAEVINTTPVFLSGQGTSCQGAKHWYHIHDIHTWDIT